MYLNTAVPDPAVVSLQMADAVAGTILRQESTFDWMGNVLKASWQFLLRMIATVSSWLSWLGPPLAWTFQALYDAGSFVQLHPHPFHILGWSLFFGPIIVLLPCLLLLEIFILLSFNFSSLFHGMAPGTYPLSSIMPVILQPTTLALHHGRVVRAISTCSGNCSTLLTFLFYLGSIEDRFEGLKDHFMDWRESLFATIEHWTARINKWTTDYPALLVIRLLAGGMSLYILFGIWNGW